MDHCWQHRFLSSCGALMLSYARVTELLLFVNWKWFGLVMQTHLISFFHRFVANLFRVFKRLTTVIFISFVLSLPLAFAVLNKMATNFTENLVNCLVDILCTFSDGSHLYFWGNEIVACSLTIQLKLTHLNVTSPPSKMFYFESNS